MKKFKRFLGKCSGLLKFGICMLLIFWAAGLGSFLNDWWDSNAGWREMRANENYEELEKAKKKLTVFGDDLSEKARASKQYIFKEYYEDIKKLKLKNKELYHRELFEEFSRVKRSLYYRVKQNFKKRELLLGFQKAKEEMWRADLAYGYWLKENDVYRNGGDENLIKLTEPRKSTSTLKGLKKLVVLVAIFLGWFGGVCIKGSFLALPLYIIRMREDKGILQTVLAEKKKFLLSVFLWPVLIFSYPQNVYRIIRVEVELRRLGNAFRKLSLKERKTIREVAGSADYKEWISSFRKVNENAFQRTFFLALLAAVSLYLISPVIIISEVSGVSRDGLMAYSSASEYDIDGSDESENQKLSKKSYISKATRNIIVMTFEKLRMFEKRLYYEEIVNRIDHIPISRLFSSRMLTLN